MTNRKQKVRAVKAWWQEYEVRGGNDGKRGIYLTAYHKTGGSDDWLRTRILLGIEYLFLERCPRCLLSLRFIFSGRLVCRARTHRHWTTE